MSTARSEGDRRGDESLLSAMALGDEEAAVAFVRRYQRRVYGLALAILRDGPLAEDVAQEALLRVWRHAAAYDARRGSVTSWLLTITRNLAVDAIRLQRSLPLDPEYFLALGTVSREAGPVELVERSDATGEVLAALRALSAEQRRALVLAAFYGLTASEVAERESIPLGTAKTRIRSGLATLRHGLGLGRSGLCSPGSSKEVSDA